jgi:F-type H+-transporting ATPase subunit delta
MNLDEATHHATVFDDATQHVARVYAEAFLNAAEKSGQAEEPLQNLDSLVDQVFPQDRYLEAFLTSKAVSRERKERALRAAFGGRASPLFLNFLLVLNDHDRLDALRSITASARSLHEERTGKIRVQVRSALPLADDQRQRLQQELRETFGRDPVLETRVDADLLGGMTVQVGDVMYDASVRTRLEKIRNQLLERSSHAIQSQRDRFRSPAGDDRGPR